MCCYAAAGLACIYACLVRKLRAQSQQLVTACRAPYGKIGQEPVPHPAACTSVLLHLHSRVSAGLRKADLVTQHDLQQHLHHSHPTLKGTSVHG